CLAGVGFRGIQVDHHGIVGGRGVTVTRGSVASGHAGQLEAASRPSCMTRAPETVPWTDLSVRSASISVRIVTPTWGLLRIVSLEVARAQSSTDQVMSIKVVDADVPKGNGSSSVVTV